MQDGKDGIASGREAVEKARELLDKPFKVKKTVPLQISKESIWSSMLVSFQASSSAKASCIGRGRGWQNYWGQLLLLGQARQSCADWSLSNLATRQRKIYWQCGHTCKAEEDLHSQRSIGNIVMSWALLTEGMRASIVNREPAKKAWGGNPPSKAFDQAFNTDAGQAWYAKAKCGLGLQSHQTAVYTWWK